MFSKKAVIPEIKYVSNLIRRYISMVSSERNIDLTGQHMHILYYIENERDSGKDVFQRDIESRINVRPSTATSILKVLEKNGYIKREPVEADARLKKLVLTEKADEMKNLTFDMMSEVETKIIEGISQEELNAFFEVIEKMKKNLITMNDKKRPDNQGGKTKWV